MRQRAAELGEAIRAEDGVGDAIAFLSRKGLLVPPGQDVTRDDAPTLHRYKDCGQ